MDGREALTHSFQEPTSIYLFLPDVHSNIARATSNRLRTKETSRIKVILKLLGGPEVRACIRMRNDGVVRLHPCKNKIVVHVVGPRLAIYLPLLILKVPMPAIRTTPYCSWVYYGTTPSIQKCKSAL